MPTNNQQPGLDSLISPTVMRTTDRPSSLMKTLSRLETSPQQQPSTQLPSEPNIMDAPPVSMPRPINSDDQVMNWELVDQIVSDVASRMPDLLDRHGITDKKSEEEMARGQILEAVNIEAQKALKTHGEHWRTEWMHLMASAVFDALYRNGRLEPLLSNYQYEEIEDIIVQGSDPVWVTWANGKREQLDPVFDTDEQFISWATRIGAEESRPFTSVHPFLNATLPGGHRLAAVRDVVPRPRATIRRHRLIDVTLADLRELGTIDTVLEEFLSAAVRAGKSIIVAGDQGAGKTTMVRALLNCLNPSIPLITIESERELHMDKLPDKHRIVLAMEGRPGGGEVGIDGQAIGEIDLSRLLTEALRHGSGGRVIVGEARGKEILAMFKSMQSGIGGMSTVHAKSAGEVLGRLVTLAKDDGNVDTDFATRLVATHVDVIVYISSRPDANGKRNRRVEEVLEIELGESGEGVATTQVFRPSVHHRAVPNMPPSYLAELVEEGFNSDLLNYPDGLWGVS